ERGEDTGEITRNAIDEGMEAGLGQALSLGAVLDRSKVPTRGGEADPTLARRIGEGAAGFEAYDSQYLEHEFMEQVWQVAGIRREYGHNRHSMGSYRRTKFSKRWRPGRRRIPRMQHRYPPK